MLPGDENATPITNDTSATSIGGADQGTGGVASADAPAAAAPAANPVAASPTAQGGAATSAPAAPAAPTGAPADGRMNPAQKVMHGILSALGGTTDTVYRRATADDVKNGLAKQEGQMITSQVTANPWKRIIAGAITGVAAGAGVKPGPNHLGRAASAGFAAGNDMVQGVENNKINHANQDFDATQQATVRKAQTALLNQQISELAFKNSRSKITATFDDAARENTFAQLVQQGGANSRDLGIFPDVNSLIKAHGEMPDLLKQQAQGNIIGIPHINESGQIDGMHYAMVTPEWKNAKLDADQPFYRIIPPAKPGDKPTVKAEMVKAGTMTNGEYWNASMANEKSFQEMYEKQADRTSEEKRNAATNAAHVQGIGMEQAGENARTDKKLHGDSSSVYAYDPATNKTVLTTKGDATERGLQGIRKVGQGDISKDQHDIRVLNDVSLKANNVMNAAKAMDERSWGQAAIAAKELADNPNTTANNLLKSGVMKHATKQVKAYIIAVQNLRESSMGLQKVLTGTARTNETQLQALLNTLPGVEPDASTVQQRLQNFTQNITMLRQGIPDLPGMDKVELQNAPAGATDEVYVDGKLTGHMVSGKYVPLEKK